MAGDIKFPSPFRVSFLLIKIKIMIGDDNNGFRLLSEYRFFLLELYSDEYGRVWTFPSPFRVSFLLIFQVNL